MRIEHLFFVLFLVGACWLVPFLPFVRKSGLSTLVARWLFVFKILASLGVAFYFATSSSNGDYIAFNKEGEIQYQLLLNDPALFFTELTADIKRYGLGRIFATQDSFWAYLRFNLLFKVIGALDLLTKGNFYFNTAVFSSFGFLAHLAFYRVFKTIYPIHNWLIIPCFLLPSALMYTSCFHKDGIVFMCLALISFCLQRLLLNSRKKLKYLLSILIGCVVLFLFRNYVLVALVPAIIVALLYKQLDTNKLAAVIATYAVFIILFFASASIPSFSLPAAVMHRKADFAVLRGNTDISMRELSPSMLSFIRNFPEAINHTLLRPYLWEYRRAGVVLAALEIFTYLLLALAFIFFRKRRMGPLDSFNVFGLALFFNMILIIGYTIPNLGAIVRYRSVFWVFLMTPLLCNIDWQKIRNRVFPARLAG